MWHAASPNQTTRSSSAGKPQFPLTQQSNTHTKTHSIPYSEQGESILHSAPGVFGRECTGTRPMWLERDVSGPGSDPAVIALRCDWLRSGAPSAPGRGRTITAMINSTQHRQQQMSSCLEPVEDFARPVHTVPDSRSPETFRISFLRL